MVTIKHVISYAKIIVINFLKYICYSYLRNTDLTNMNINYETKFQSDSEGSDEFVESIVSTSGKTSESLLSAPTLYSDSEISEKVSLMMY